MRMTKRHAPAPADVIHRVIQLWYRTRAKVFTPFMGWSGPRCTKRLPATASASGELKESYYRQAVLNLQSLNESKIETPALFDEVES